MVFPAEPYQDLASPARRDLYLLELADVQASAVHVAGVPHQDGVSCSSSVSVHEKGCGGNIQVTFSSS